MKFKSILAVFATISFLASCKKNDVNNPDPNPPISAANRLKDSVLFYTRDVYLWYSQIPSSFNARNYANADKIMTAVRKYSIEPGFNQSVDRWSFAVKKQEWDNISSGAAQDFGLNVFFRANDDLRVSYIEKASPAGRAGIRRGWRIKSINGNSNITNSNADLIVQAVYNSPNTSFTFEKPDGSSVNLDLRAAAYQEHPVFLDSVYTAGSKKVGYLVFNSFLGDTTEIHKAFKRIFNRFSQQSVGEVIIDLRYNGGGYVSVQEKLAGYLVNSSADGQVMMRQQFNDKYTQFNETMNFNKQGSINLNRIFFIVSGSTASASELLINNLKPYANVVLVGPEKTYGKPVGYFPIPIESWYIFPVSFRSINKNGEGNYFDGFALDNQVADGLDKDWGDSNESAFASVLRYITSGSFKISSPAISQEDLQVSAVNKVLDEPSFKGTIGTRRIFK